VFVINCNLQRLDGPVRGNGKIIQELEAAFSAPAGTSSRWSGARAGIRCSRAITKGLLRRRMEECVDGEYQNFKAKGGAYTREHFFGKYPELKEMVANMSDEEIWRLNRGGHDARKVYAAYHQAVEHKGQPTVILAKTVKGYGMGQGRRRAEHHAPAEEARRRRPARFRDRFNIPISDEDIASCRTTSRRRTTARRCKYLRERASARRLPAGATHVAPPLQVPPLEAFRALLEAAATVRSRPRWRSCAS
jgi:pyruvate dehydrogenase E1 component